MTDTPKKVYPRMVAPGREMARLREERGFSQREAAKRAGVGTFQQLAGLEKGQVEHPSMQTLVGYGNLYGKTPNEIARLYGYWAEYEQEESGYITIIRDATGGLPPAQREQVLATMARYATNELLERLKG